MAEGFHHEPNQPAHFEGGMRVPMIPPASLEFKDKIATVVLPPEGTPVARNTEVYGNPRFLRNLTSTGPPRFEHCIGTWKYGDRVLTHSILPYLLLGPMNFARDRESMQAAGVTMMIAVRSKSSAERTPNIMNPARFPSAPGIDTATFDMDTSYDAVSGRYAVIKAMNDHIEAACEGRHIQDLDDIPAKILVFCETGNDRSALLVIMYLMVVWGLDGVTAYQAVQARRFGIGTGPVMATMLQTLTHICNAERQVIAVSNSELGPTPVANTRAAKRTIEDVHTADEDLDMDMEGSAAPDATRRPGVTPFKDIDDSSLYPTCNIQHSGSQRKKMTGHHS